MAWWRLSGRFPEPEYYVSFEAPSEIKPGAEAVFRGGIWSRKGDCTETISIPNAPFDLVVSKFNGTEAWRWSLTDGSWSPLTQEFGSRDVYPFGIEWDLRDNKGHSLPEGAYWLQSFQIIERSGGTPELRPSTPRLFFIGLRLRLTHWLEVWIEAPEIVKSGGDVPLVIRVRNKSADPVDLIYEMTPYNFVVTKEDSSEVWRQSRWRGSGIEFPDGALLHPGETLSFQTTWKQHDNTCKPGTGEGDVPCVGNPVSPGNYLVEVTFEAQLADTSYEDTIKVGPLELTIRP
ncbi:MAG: hypothetical protein FJ320_07955 [SAR202 cluster bacterium]|nr:hypothetical protein [SAR202 cluster bacterium]